MTWTLFFQLVGLILVTGVVVSMIKATDSGKKKP